MLSIANKYLLSTKIRKNQSKNVSKYFPQKVLLETHHGVEIHHRENQNETHQEHVQF